MQNVHAKTDHTYAHTLEQEHGCPKFFQEQTLSFHEGKTFAKNRKTIIIIIIKHCIYTY